MKRKRNGVIFFHVSRHVLKKNMIYDNYPMFISDTNIHDVFPLQFHTIVMNSFQSLLALNPRD